MPLTAQAADVAGRSIAAAVPLHRLDPRLVNGAAVVEIAAFVTMVVSATGAAFGGLALASAAFVGLHLADHRSVLAIQEDGEATILSAGRDGRPLAVRTSTPHAPTLPEPTGLAAAVRLDGVRWWVDRSAYPLLVEARASVLTAPP
jgi:hypothetical protein